MTAVHTYFYIAVDTQRGCHNLKKNKVQNFAQIFTIDSPDSQEMQLPELCN